MIKKGEKGGGNHLMFKLELWVSQFVSLLGYQIVFRRVVDRGDIFFERRKDYIVRLRSFDIHNCKN